MWGIIFIFLKKKKSDAIVSIWKKQGKQTKAVFFLSDNLELGIMDVLLDSVLFIVQTQEAWISGGNLWDTIE